MAEAILMSGYECTECGNLITHIEPVDIWECSECETRYLNEEEAKECCPDDDA